MTVAEVHAAAAVAAAAAPAPMTAAEAHTAAAEEGLALVRAENSTGFKGVYRGGAKSSAGKPFKAELRNKSLGYFATAEEAALAVARFLVPKDVAAPAASSPKRPAASVATESARKRGKQPADIFFVQAELAADNDERAAFRLSR